MAWSTSLNSSWPRDSWGKQILPIIIVNLILFIRTGPLLYGNPILSGDLDVLFAKYDVNGDGQIDFDEFVGLIEEDLESFPLRKPTIPE